MPQDNTNPIQLDTNLSIEQYRKHIQQILKDVEAGETISHEDLKKESETW